MALRSLKQTYERMVNELRMSGSSNSYSDLNSLKKKIDTMYAYRSNKIQDPDPSNFPDNTPGRIQNICHQHFYNTFDDFQEKTGVSYSLSIGDLNNAMDKMAYCTCNSRSADGCNCVSRQLGNTCDCNVRNPIECNCVYRHGGKYDPICICNARYAGCACVSRTSQIDCDCHGRCACNVVNEYTMQDPKTVGDCSCVSRTYGNVCECHNRTVAPYANCECQARTLPGPCTCDQRTPVSQSGCVWNFQSRCDCQHRSAAATEACACNYRTGANVTDYCACVSRTSNASCAYHVTNK